MFRANIENPSSLIIGRAADGAPVIYDPKTNIIVIRDPGAADAGTVFKPTRGANYAENIKIANRVPSIPPGELADGRFPGPAPPRPAGPSGAEPGPSASPGRVPVEAGPPARPSPGTGEGGGAMSRLHLGGGLPADSPALGPHPVYPPHSHHHPPVLGEEEDEIPPSP
jgi:hypothetical protein